MKIVYTSDLHGEISLYQDLLQFAASTSAEAIAIGGDLLPSFPPTRRYEDMVPHQKAFIDQFLLPFFKRLYESTPVESIFLIAGNWDVSYSYLFKEPTDYLINLNQKSFRLKNELELIGYPFVPVTPFRPKDFEKMDGPEAPWPPQKKPSYISSPDRSDRLLAIDPCVYLRGRESIGQDLQNLPEPQHADKTIYIMHSPPHATLLDVTRGGDQVGSRSIRVFIEEKQPFLTFHGHIHESPECSGHYLDRIGKTLAVNPGQFTWGRGSVSRLHALAFETDHPEETFKHTCDPPT